MVVAVAIVAVYVSIYLSIHPSIYLFISLSASLKMKLFWETSSIFELDNIRSAAILRDFLNIQICWNWQRQKQSYSVRLPQFFMLTTSKTKQFCETSFNTGKLNAELTAPVTQNHLSKSEDLMLQNAALSGNQRPDLLTSLMTMSLVPCLPREMHLGRNCNFWQGAESLAPATPNHILTSKVVRDRQFLTLLTWKCASRHNGVHFFNNSTSKSGPTLKCFLHFDFEMCFAPQRRAIFQLSSGQMAPHPPL